MTRAEANRHQYKKLSALNWLFCILSAAAVVVLVFTLWSGFDYIKGAWGSISTDW